MMCFWFLFYGRNILLCTSNYRRGGWLVQATRHVASWRSSFSRTNTNMLPCPTTTDRGGVGSGLWIPTNNVHHHTYIDTPWSRTTVHVHTSVRARAWGVYGAGRRETNDSAVRSTILLYSILDPPVSNSLSQRASALGKPNQPHFCVNDCSRARKRSFYACLNICTRTTHVHTNTYLQTKWNALDCVLLSQYAIFYLTLRNQAV